MKICVMICTYDRPAAIHQLTKLIKSLVPSAIIVVIDDHTPGGINSEYIDHLITNPFNHGKQYWWTTVNRLFRRALRYKADYYFMMPDDCIPSRDYFTKAIKLFKSIDDKRKIALHLANNGRKRNWTGFDRVSHNKDLFLTQTTEFNFICLPEFISYRIPKIPLSRWRNNPLLGSGVGNRINNYWVARKRTIYGVKKSLIKMNRKCQESKMNPEARAQSPWILK